MRLRILFLIALYFVTSQTAFPDPASAYPDDFTCILERDGKSLFMSKEWGWWVYGDIVGTPEFAGISDHFGVNASGFSRCLNGALGWGGEFDWQSPYRWTIGSNHGPMYHKDMQLITETLFDWGFPQAPNHLQLSCDINAVPTSNALIYSKIAGPKTTVYGTPPGSYMFAYIDYSGGGTGIATCFGATDLKGNQLVPAALGKCSNGVLLPNACQAEIQARFPMNFCVRGCDGPTYGTQRLRSHLNPAIYGNPSLGFPKNHMPLSTPSTRKSFAAPLIAPIFWQHKKATDLRGLDLTINCLPSKPSATWACEGPVLGGALAVAGACMEGVTTGIECYGFNSGPDVKLLTPWAESEAFCEGLIAAGASFSGGGFGEHASRHHDIQQGLYKRGRGSNGEHYYVDQWGYFRYLNGHWMGQVPGQLALAQLNFKRAMLGLPGNRIPQDDGGPGIFLDNNGKVFERVSNGSVNCVR